MRLQWTIRLVSLVILLLLLCPTWAAKIIFVFPFDGNSQCSMVIPYMQALKDRGHQLTLIHAFSNCSYVEQFHSIYVNDHYETALDFNYDKWALTKWGEIDSMRNYLVKTSLNVLVNAEVKKLMRSKINYDLMVLEPSYTDGLFGLAAHFNATLIGLATFGGDWNLNTLVGHSASTTFEPLIPIGFSRGTTLMDRLYNWALISEEWMIHKLIFLPGLRVVHDHFFGHLKQSFSELRQSFSMILLNQHFSLFDARPNAPNLIEIGGMHLPKQLPQLPLDLEHFIEEAVHGVIYMCLGTDLRSMDLSSDTLAAILDTFATLPQRIIWKYEGHPRPNVSDNIYMDEWLPQQAILAHPNVRVFIGHGGMLGIIEATYHAKPVLGMPLFFDQIRNVERMKSEGAALLLDILKLTRQEFKSAVKQLLDQPKYRNNAKVLSQRFRDQPMHPLDTAVYWTEYILRYKGAPHMRISPSNIKLMDYYSIDNFLMVAARVSFVVAVVIYALHKFGQFSKRYLSMIVLFYRQLNESRELIRQRIN